MQLSNFIALIIGTVFLFAFLFPSKKMLHNNNPLGALMWVGLGCALAYYGWQEFGGLTYTPNTGF